MFNASGKGFSIKFENGWTASVQFGPGNYCDNKMVGYHDLPKHTSCANAEVAAWSKDDVWHNFGDDTVKGWMSPADVLKFLNMVAKKKE